MSKSEVNIIKSFNVSKLKSETALSSLKQSIETGRELNYERCHNNYDNLHSAKFKPKKVKPTNLYVCKLLYPKENIYPTCDHQNNFAVDRSTFNGDDYLSFLSTPKKHYEKPRPRWVWRWIPPCTAHLNSLSQPKKNHLISTLHEHRYHFSFERVENFINKIHFGEHQTPQDVVQSMRQKLKNSRNRIKLQTCEIKRLRMKIARSKQFEDVSSQLLTNIRNMLHCDRPMNEDCRKLAKLILPKLCELTGYNIPNRNSTNDLDRAHILLSEKFAMAIYDYLKNRCSTVGKEYEEESECFKLFKMMCLPIEGYYPAELKTIEIKDEPTDVEDSQASHDEDDDSKEDGESLIFDDVKLDEDVSNNEQKLSFLRESQIKVSLDECKQTFNALNEITEKLAEKKSQKDTKRQERAEREKALTKEKAEREAARILQEKAEAKARRKARRRRGKAGCFGNTNPKPQWQVEWKETDENELCKESTNSP